MIHETQQFVSSLAFNQIREPKIYVDEKVESITIGTERMYLQKLRDGTKKLLEDVESRYVKLTRGNKVLTRMPDDVLDDLADTRRGYSFIREEPFRSKQHSLLLFLVEEYRLAMVDGSGRIAWDIPEVKNFLIKSARVWEPLYHLIYLTVHVSSRGTQFIDHQISNADRHRNLFMQGSEMFIITGYSKTTNARDLDSCTPGFLPRKVAEWALEMLGGGLRSAEAILAGIAYGEEAEHLYKT